MRRVAGPRDRVTSALDRWVISVALPALVVSKMSRASFGEETLLPVAVAWGAMALCAGVVLAVSRRRRWPAPVTGSVLLVGVLGNTSFLGLGVVGALLGGDHLAAAISYDQLGSFLALATYGSFVAGRFGDGARGWRPVLRRLIRFAPFLALVSSPLVALIDPPEVFHSVLGVPGATVGPVAMLSLGWRFTRSGWKERPDAVVVALVVKMLAIPLLVVLFAVTVGPIESVAWRASVLQSAAPPMVTAGLVAISSGMDAKVASSAVGLGSIAALVTLPLWWLVVA